MDRTLAAYLPQDRRQTLARGADLPGQTSGAALFAGISGFTPLTRALGRTLGARRRARYTPGASGEEPRGGDIDNSFNPISKSADSSA